MSQVAAVSVVVPARNAAGTLAQAVESALKQEIAGNLEIVIAVGPSADRTAAVAAALAAADARVSVVPNPSGATGAGLNAAIAASTGAVVARLDAHAVLPPDYLATALKVLQETDAANVGGVQRAVGSTPFEEAVAVAMTSKLGTGDAKFHYGGESGPVDTVYLGVFQRAVLERLGGFDAALLRNQDYELNHRIRQAGGVVWFDPTLQVTYRPRSTPQALARQYYDYGRWKREVVRRHPRSLKWRQAVPPVVLAANAAGLLLGLRDRRALAVPGLYAAVVLGVSARLGRSRPVATAVRLPVAFSIMHGAWGAGFFRGGARRAASVDTTPAGVAPRSSPDAS